jgi:hypothetical protein
MLSILGENLIDATMTERETNAEEEKVKEPLLHAVHECISIAASRNRYYNINHSL